MPFVNGDVTHRSKPLKFKFQDQVALIDNEYKIYSKDKGESFELFNIFEDSGERVDLADEAPERLYKMISLWKEWQVSVSNSAMGNDY